MKRRAVLAVTLVAFLTVGGGLVVDSQRDPVRAADPIAQAKAQRDAIEAQLAEQRARLARLKATSAALAQQLDVTKAELAQITAEYERVLLQLADVRDQIDEIKAHLKELREQIDELEQQLDAVAEDIRQQTADLWVREALLQDHLRSAYEQSQVSLLEVMLSSESLDAATSQVGYLLNISDQDQVLADEIAAIREELEVKRVTLRDGWRALREAKAEATQEEEILEDRQAELKVLETRTAELKAAAERKKAQQEAALNDALNAQGNVTTQIVNNQRAAEAATALVNRLVAEQAALEEARRRAEEEARRRSQTISASGYRWPEAAPRITQEWGPTSFALEPPYTYNGHYYPHFHTGIDMASGCGTPILAAKAGVVLASGRPLWPYDSGYGVILDHGDGIRTWYWHITSQVLVSPGQIVNTGQVIGYEGNTGYSTGCHLHFATYVNGVYENPRRVLP
jgi:murein DD-endopeptidase MepM/ murein hydrolase activator NlpD